MAGQPVLEELAGGPGEEEIDRLARQRPDIFPSVWSEVGFLYSVSMSTALMEYFVAGFNIILPKVSEDLRIAQASKTWPANAFSLVVACFLIVFGRAADMHGGYTVYMGGIAWFTVWSFIAGWAQNEIMIDVCRALQGIGPAAFLPTGLMLLGSFYRPGPRKNMSMGIYGAMAPVGFYLGIFFAGITAQYASWRWWFFIGSACYGTAFTGLGNCRVGRQAGSAAAARKGPTTEHVAHVTPRD